MTKIAVFAGHGGSDYGASYNGLYEKDITLESALALTSELRRRGYDVINNRTTDVDRSVSADARLANAEKVDAVIELHVNSNYGVPGTGTETFYSVTGSGRELAEKISENISALGFVNRGAKTYPNIFGGDYLGIIRLTNAPAVLVEEFFINNPSDVAMYDVREMATAIADAVFSVYPVGITSDDVIANVQRTLNERYDSGLAVDGIYGRKTKAAIIKGLQTELNSQFGAGLNVDGIFGEKTKNALRNVKIGARGNITYLIQTALYILGYDVKPDGIFGNKTQTAVKRFQTLNSLTPDGIAGKRTQSLLFSKI